MRSHRFHVRILLALLFVSLPLGLVGKANGVFAGHQNESIRVLVAYHSLSGNTEKMARAVARGVQSVPFTQVELQPVSTVTASQLFAADALIVGSPVYWSNMAGTVKMFFDDWQFKFGVYPEFKMRNKVGAAFATGGQVSSGKEVTMLTILAAMLGNQMIVVGGGGAFGASATTEGDSPGINEREIGDAEALGRRVAEVAWIVKKGQWSSSRHEGMPAN